MYFPLLFFAVVAAVSAQTEKPGQRDVRAPQGHIKYSDPNGLKVNWKFYNPKQQAQLQAANSQRSQRAEVGTDFPGHPRFIQQQQKDYENLRGLQPQKDHTRIAKQSQSSFLSPGSHFGQDSLFKQETQFSPESLFKQESHFEQENPFRQENHFGQGSLFRQGTQFGHESSFRQDNQFGQGPRFPQEQQQQQHQFQGEKFAQGPNKPQQLDQDQLTYRPYSDVPSHIKQLLVRTYEPQKPYVDPSAFIYSNIQQQPVQQESSRAAHQFETEAPRYKESFRSESSQASRPASLRSYDNGLSQQQSRIQYRTDFEFPNRNQQQSELRQFHRPTQVDQQVHNQLPFVPAPKLNLDKNMPTEIQQLLQFQAQIPYDVIANRIYYKPKTLFIPRPLSEDAKASHSYRSEVIYLNDGEIDPDRTKSNEDQRQ
ncbi:uncharacterized protein DDB_G0290301-like isoform X2 [Prorops nasuta]|uniref:uncharacterized protein DDB_G0290301-like isoform X2 n=1 Tax=Prorops nasuta TaxID=863751 RepID=UPI0034CF08B7